MAKKLAKNGASLSVLIADDERQVVEILKLSLQSLGHEIIAIAENGLDAVELATLHYPDLVVMDLNMPGMDGVLASKKILSTLDVPIIISSGRSDSEALESTQHLDIQAFLVKPFGRDQLKSAISVAVGQHRKKVAAKERISTLTNELEIFKNHEQELLSNAQKLLQIKKEYSDVVSALDRLGGGFVILDENGKQQFVTRIASQLLKQFFPSFAEEELPCELASWTTHQKALAAQDIPLKPLVLKRQESHLIIRFVSNPAEKVFYLVVEEKKTVMSPKPLEALGLTPREAEVLLWVAQGKSNADIGTIVGSATRTVDKHIERIFRKLGVETRTAAAAEALEILTSHSLN